MTNPDLQKVDPGFVFYKMNTNKHKMGLALSGGGMRGAAHIGALKALEENDILPDCICGVSAGAIVGVLYAAGYEPREILSFFTETASFKSLKPVFPSKGLLSLDIVERFLKSKIPHNSFENLERPFSLAVTNLHSGRSEVYTTGPLVDLVIASCSIPMVFKPRTIDKQAFVDGGLVTNLSVKPLVGQCDRIIAVNVLPVPPSAQRFKNFISIGLRSFEIVIRGNTRKEMHYADLVIEPAGITKISFFDIRKIQELYQMGYDNTMERMEEIKALVGG